MRCGHQRLACDNVHDPRDESENNPCDLGVVVWSTSWTFSQKVQAIRRVLTSSSRETSSLAGVSYGYEEKSKFLVAVFESSMCTQTDNRLEAPCFDVTYRSQYHTRTIAILAGVFMLLLP